MNTTPRVLHAAHEQDVRLHVPHVQLPIVFVPGVMGSRLTDPRTDQLVWNPMGIPIGDGPGEFAVDFETLHQTSIEFVADETHPYDDQTKQELYNEVTNATHVVLDFYGTMLQMLASLDLSELNTHGVRPKVYCAGYDWRLDCARGALRVAAVVERALRETRASQVIIVAHSMGGLVSRYFSRVLGGESRIHTMILVGSPTLGATTAYAQIKNGLRGTYLDEVFDDIVTPADPATILETTAQETLAAVSTTFLAISASSLKGFSATDGVTMVLGDVYLAFCLGAGRMLSRKETMGLSRRFTGLFQLLPNAIFCAEAPEWLRFDPLATGHAPTGKMLRFPTLMQAGTHAMTSLTDVLLTARPRMAADVRKGVTELLAPDAQKRTSLQATRNLETLEEKLATMVADGISSPETAVAQWKEIMERAEESFLDCRNAHRLYADIYTGLLDVVQHRAICAANLELVWQFHDALTVRPREETAESAADLVRSVCDPVRKMLAMPSDKAPRRSAAEEAERKSAQAKRHKETQPRVYMHPRTVSIFCETIQCETGGFVLPLDVYSNDDTNVVRWKLLPNLDELMTDMSGRTTPWVMGDGQVPVLSSNPPVERLSVPFIEKISVPDVVHGNMCEQAGVQQAIRDSIGKAIPLLALR